MSKQPGGSFRHPNKEWGRKARKQEDGYRNLNGRGRRDAIAEQAADVTWEPAATIDPIYLKIWDDATGDTLYTHWFKEPEADD